MAVAIVSKMLDALGLGSENEFLGETEKFKKT